MGPIAHNTCTETCCKYEAMVNCWMV